MITGKTKICGIIGNPVSHSMSPPIHNAAFQKLRLDYVYAAFPVTDLEEAVHGISALGIHGVNVTVPYKVDVIEFLDSIDPLAEKIGAVNTILNHKGLKGFNTDAGGALAALSKNNVKVKGKNVVVMGAGGASRAICFALSGANITIANRTEEKAASLASSIGAGCIGLNGKSMKAALKEADILINATRVGMGRNETLVKSKMLNPATTVFDIVYPETPLLNEAKKAGCRAISGLEMLVYQAAESFEIWTGKKAPIKAMKQAVGLPWKKRT